MSSQPGTATRPSTVEHTDVCIVGSGFAGMGMAIRLREAGLGSCVILEKADEVGGTWRDNTYPGCACDIPSHLYSFSFAPNPDWTRMYPTQPEIQAYLRRVADAYGLRSLLRFGAEVAEARFDRATARWTVTTRDGRQVVARFLVLGMGGLSRPAIPDIPGLDAFQGRVFHSQSWDHAYDLSGKRVAVIGTGASAIQFVPRIAPKLARLDLYQRTPPWVIPKPDRGFLALERWLFRHVPATAKLLRGLIYLRQEVLALGFTRFPGLLRSFEKQALKHLERQVPDPGLRAKLTPDYRLGCKRVLISNDYYPALQLPQVQVLTSGVDRITGTGVVDRDGTLREVDALILATGFRATDMLSPTRVFGPDGTELDTLWRSTGIAAHWGTTVAGFPNLFMLVGPNTGLGHNSIVYMIESQLNLVIDLLRRAKAKGAVTVEPTAEAQQAFNTAVQSRMRRTVWMSGCRSWYLDAAGRNPTLWPGFTLAFRRRTRRADPVEYRFG